MFGDLRYGPAVRGRFECPLLLREPCNRLEEIVAGGLKLLQRRCALFGSNRGGRGWWCGLGYRRGQCHTKHRLDQNCRGLSCLHEHPPEDVTRGATRGLRIQKSHQLLFFSFSSSITL